MKKVLWITLLVALLLPFSLKTQAADWSNNCGGQIVLTLKGEPADLGHGWKSITNGMVFSMPGNNFTLFWGYFGAKKGWMSIYTGPVFNYGNTDPVLAGTMLDMPLGSRCVWSTEADLIVGEGFTDQYYWSGIDFNFTAFTKAMWVGPQVEAIHSAGKTYAQLGMRLGMGPFQAGLYAGDHGYNTRIGITVRI